MSYSSKAVWLNFVLSLIFAAGMLTLGCDNSGGESGSGGENTETVSNLAGNIRIEGSSTVEPISNKAKELFNKKFPNVNVSVSGQGTGNGFKALAKKECDISDASRPIKLKEVEDCRQNGVSFYEIPVAYDGLTVVVNPENDFVESLTVDQLRLIFSEETAAKTWKEVDPSWPDEKISIFAPGIASGTHDYFVEVIGKRIRADSQTILSEDDKQLARGVKGDRNAIGFFGFAYYAADRESLRAVPIVNSKGDAVAPSIETIESGAYEPLSRPLFIYVNTESYERAEVNEFVNFFLENAAEIVSQAAYVSLPAAVYDAAFDTIEQQRSGSRYWTEAGEHREGSVVELFSAE